MLTAAEHPRGPGRVRGRPAIAQSLNGLLRRVGRFLQHRARTQADQRWAARLYDELDVALRHARQETD